MKVKVAAKDEEVELSALNPNRFYQQLISPVDQAGVAAEKLKIRSSRVIPKQNGPVMAVVVAIERNFFARKINFFPGFSALSRLQSDAAS